ncbi:hypothetical protein QBC39DRAFT_362580 [Podospora conica]|nr:hypothetical protein QBC39DRAFT_362580 [Schizothecium conicum]
MRVSHALWLIVMRGRNVVSAATKSLNLVQAWLSASGRSETPANYFSAVLRHTPLCPIGLRRHCVRLVPATSSHAQHALQVDPGTEVGQDAHPACNDAMP